MQYAVVIQPRPNGGFIASVPTLPGCLSQGATEDEALTNIRAAIAKQLKHVKVVQIEVDEDGAVPKNPWDNIIGMFKDDPIFDRVDREIKRNRRRLRKKPRRR
jgi:predicted RNase H-like HicB family nuclease